MKQQLFVSDRFSIAQLIGTRISDLQIWEILEFHISSIPVGPMGPAPMAFCGLNPPSSLSDERAWDFHPADTAEVFFMAMPKMMSWCGRQCIFVIYLHIHMYSLHVPPYSYLYLCLCIWIYHTYLWINSEIWCTVSTIRSESLQTLFPTCSMQITSCTKKSTQFRFRKHQWFAFSELSCLPPVPKEILHFQQVGSLWSLWFSWFHQRPQRFWPRVGDDMNLCRKSIPACTHRGSWSECLKKKCWNTKLWP